MDPDPRPVYSIGAVGRMLSIAPATLRSWEERYGLVVPQRSAGGQRLYSREQVDQLRFVKERLAEGVHASDAHRLLAERLGGPGGTVVDRPRQSPAGHSHVLLAEPDPHAATLAEFFLSSQGYAVERASSAEQARARFTAARPTLVVVELMISGGVGAELCRVFKAEGVPVVAISVLEAGARALAAGADAFLTKPLEPGALVATVNDVLGSTAVLPSPSGGDR